MSLESIEWLGSSIRNNTAQDLLNVLNMNKEEYERQEEEKLMNNFLTEEERQEYNKLKGLERFWKLTWKVLPESAKRKLEEYRMRIGESIQGDWMVDKEWTWEVLDIPEELKEYREKWKEKIKNISDESKEKIIKAAENIEVKVNVDSDWSRLIEFKLRGKTCKILDPRLEDHTDDEYRTPVNYSSITEIDRDYVKLWWMEWDNVDEWENEKLKAYVKKKESEWLHIPKIEEMKTLLRELWKQANLSEAKDQIAMLMYLTWMEWDYWLSMWDYKKSWSENSRSLLDCRDAYRYFDDDGLYNSYASLCMIAF